MTAQRSLKIAEQTAEDTGDASTVDAEATAPDLDVETRPSLYDQAEATDGLPVNRRRLPRFVTSVLGEMGVADESIDEARVLDELHDDPDGDVDFAFLLVWPSDDLLLVGSDPTAKDALPWFAYHVGPNDPMPAPTDVDSALARLKPTDVEQALHEDEYLPDRQGEWWLLPTPQVPASEVFKPGVGSRPYGPSPLGNHVPREYAFTVSSREFVTRFNEYVGDAGPSSIDTPMEVLEWVRRQQNRRPTPEYAPDWDDVRDMAGDVLVRGTIRHREHDHFVEDVGDVWHRAETHNVDVWTADAVGLEPRID